MKNYLINKIMSYFDLDHFRFSPPYNYVQNVTEFNIHNYLGCNKSDIKNWCIVGGYIASEIAVIGKNYPEAHFTVFECSNRYIRLLEEKWAKNQRVEIINKAVSNNCGELTFYETSLLGSGSLLELGDLHKNSYGSKSAESFVVQATTLDSFFLERPPIDVLQIDVQGAEKLVLQGAVKVIENVRAILIEVSLMENLYRGGATFDEIFLMLKKLGFNVALVGTDFNLTGNALFVRS